MVLPDSDRVPRVPSYSGTVPAALGFRLRGYHPLWPAFPGRSTISAHYRAVSAETTGRPYNPTRMLEWFGLVRVRSPLLAESRLIYFPEGTEMFQFPSFATPDLWNSVRVAWTSSTPVSRFGDPRIDACLRLPVAYRSFATSFIASWCQGIHRMPLLA